MRILAIDCSAGPASCAISEDGKIIASAYVNVRLTHSQTLLPMVKNTLDTALLKLDDIDAFAISNGPGSFTGIRIGISAVKGLAVPENKPCIPVSTLLATAYSHLGFDGIVCSVMDARCNQVYGAFFKIKNGLVTRLTEDRAVMVSEIETEIKNYSDEKIIISGDGADLFSLFADNNKNVTIAKEPVKYQTACGVALATSECEAVSPDELKPFYLRLPQAERELKAKGERN